MFTAASLSAASVKEMDRTFVLNFASYGTVGADVATVSRDAPSQETVGRPTRTGAPSGFVPRR
jgi:hypothetical protein